MKLHIIRLMISILGQVANQEFNLNKSVTPKLCRLHKLIAFYKNSFHICAEKNYY